MKRRPVCLVCLFLMLCFYVTDLVGISMINGNPLPVSVQKYISEHPKLTVSGEVQNCQAAEYSLSDGAGNPVEARQYQTPVPLPYRSDISVPVVLTLPSEESMESFCPV